MNSYSEPVCNYVFWVSSLPDSEMGPTGRMTHDLDQIFGASNIGFLHKRIRHVDELANFLSCIKRCSANRGLRPLIHLDAHGNPEPWPLSNWPELLPCVAFIDRPAERD